MIGIRIEGEKSPVQLQLLLLYEHRSCDVAIDAAVVVLPYQQMLLMKTTLTHSHNRMGTMIE
jgi:hypothetical protein